MKIDDILKLPSIKIGDEIMVGKFKNRKAIVTGFTKDDKPLSEYKAKSQSNNNIKPPVRRSGSRGK